MKRNAVIKYIMANGCEFVREGRSHSWWINPEMNKRSAVPRHTEIKDNLVRKICKDLGIKPIK
ncbi:MAG: type II toxin-antitoxin system HicA family toxin [Candidatus Anammoxibacter sp.]